ncbi:MAG: lipoprotein insertase outer membrane protein LolB [gamma proteobacterium symbiont of Lucinoma myriamae]|nr:lipoprotein insertase outer membrane protein LolB [gamma proteobacterium symbiont of Lucinoma myriamae]MCU7819118.1 lipoprotein insertase outer membrane protein LolB [gamma proteobacterium symbiont of Lucinoma myriamae]MCU7831454.1 lipoprotein insertase outer membrane protein LolB [gamma proteobacterium symbiont of Lucinoma myriamae]
MRFISFIFLSLTPLTPVILNSGLLKKENIVIAQRWILIAILSLFVLSCTTSPTVKNELQSSGNITDTWRINGRISLTNEQENWYAKFNWWQKKQDFQISFSGPLGETELQLSQINNHILLKTPSGESTGNDLEQLLFQEMGFKFPVTSLRYWSQGYPNPDIASQVNYNEQQQISDIFQAGWHIQYPKRIQLEQLSGDKIWLPKKIIATEQHVKIKLIITSWHLGES